MSIYFKCVHPLQLAEWRSQVEKLPERKRHKWSDRLKTVNGVVHRVRFHKGYFQIYRDAQQQSSVCSFPKDGWAPIVELRGPPPTYEQICEAYGPEAAERFASQEHDTVVIGPAQSDEVARSIDGGLESLMTTLNLIAETHTGHHHRNKTVSVPTAVGQPVRG